MQKEKRKILVMTPVAHLDGVMETLEKYGDVIYTPDTHISEVQHTLRHTKCDAIFTNPNKQNFVLGEWVLKDTDVKVINTASTGTNHIDLKWCAENGIEVWSLTKDMELIEDLPSTAELAFGLLLALARKIPAAAEDVKKGNWDYMPFIGRQLRGMTAGIIGYGRLGKLMANYCSSFAMQVKVYDPYNDELLGHDRVDSLGGLADCDVVSVHAHATDETRGMVDRKFIESMRKGAFLVNTARGEIVDEMAVVDAIKSGMLGGYGADVLEDEYSRNVSILADFAKYHDNIIITPHIGGMTWEGQTKAYTWAAKKFKND